MKRLVLLLPLLAFTAPTWQPFAIDKYVSVQLPAQPTEVDMAKMAKLAPGKKVGHTRVWMLQTPEGSYQILRSPIGTLIKATDAAGRKSFYEGVIASAVRNEQGQIVARTAFPTAGGSGMEYKYKALNRGTGKRVLKSIRSLLLDSVVYSLNFIPTNEQDTLGLAGAEQRSKFFHSITVKP